MPVDLVCKVNGAYRVINGQLDKGTGHAIGGYPRRAQVTVPEADEVRARLTGGGGSPGV
jgi:hypothetical protein